MIRIHPYSFRIKNKGNIEYFIGTFKAVKGLKVEILDVRINPVNSNVKNSYNDYFKTLKKYEGKT